MYRKATILIGLFALIYSMLFLGGCVAGKKSVSIDEIPIPQLGEIKTVQVDTLTLPNGLKLYLLEDHELPLVRARARLAAGGFLVSADKYGTAGITGTVMRTGGTARMSGDEIDEALEAIGASVEVGIGATNGSASMNILSEYSDTGLEILADVLRTPQFAEDKIDLAKTTARTAISSRNDDPLQLAIREFRKVIYGKDSPYTRQPEYKTINAITRDDLVAFHKEYITPENVMLAVYGDFNKDEMIKKIKKYFGGWQQSGNKVPMLPDINYEFKPAVHYIEKEDITQATVLIGHIGGKTGDPDYFALTVANNVLGSGGGSRMYDEIRTRQGLAYATGSNFSSNIAYPGIYFNYVMTRMDTTVHSARAVLSEIKRMQVEAPTDAELAKAKDSYLNSFVFNFDSKGEIINRMMTYDYFDFPRDFLMKMRDNIQNVTSEDVLDVARRRFKPDQMHIVIVGMADQFDKPLSELGFPVDTIDITIPSGEVEEEIEINEESLAKGLELLKKSKNACGGKKYIDAIKATESNSSVTLFTPQGEFSMDVKSSFIAPSLSREVVSSPMFGEIITVNTAEGGWMKRAGEVSDLGADEATENKKEQFRKTIRLFQNLDNPDYKAVYVSSGELDGQPVEIIKIISNLDPEMTFKLAINSDNYMPVGKMYFGNTMMGPGNLTHHISEYKDISGVKIPFKVGIESDGNKIAELNVKDYKINPQIDKALFEKP